MKFNSNFSNNSLKISNFKTSSLKAKVKEVDFSKAMNSVNLETFCFTNFFIKKSVLIKFVRGELIQIINKTIDLEDYKIYSSSLVDYNDLYLNLKLKTIIEKTTGNRLKELPVIYKFKNKENPNFQIYAKKDINNNYEVLAIDLHHLLIVAPDKSRGEKKERSKEKYDGLKLADYNLSKIKLPNSNK